MGEPALKKENEPTEPSLRLAQADAGDDMFSMDNHAEHDEGEGNWLVSYADMMTLLVGFFVVLQSFSKVDTETFENLKKETTKLFGGEYIKPFEDLSKNLKKVTEQMQMTDQVVLTETARGVEITFRGALFFNSGSFELKDEATNLLRKLIPVIAEKAKGFGIIIEGHTDSTALNGAGAISSNWELSSVRACRVLRLFESEGFAATRLKALGWGDTKPILPNMDAQGQPIVENQSQNRRVVIKILKNFED